MTVSVSISLAADKAVAVATRSAEDDLIDEVNLCYADPLRFVRTMYPWPINGEAGPDAWQAQVLAELGAAVKGRRFNGHDAVPPIRAAISSGHGVGKAQPVSLMLHTPSGLRRWGDLQVGDTVFGANGQPTAIRAIHDRGVLPVYRVTFDDRTSTRVCGDHLWRVKGRQARRTRTGWVNLSTAKIARYGIRRSNGIARARQWEVPQQGAVEFPARPLPILPYTLGVWLGDGARNSGIITSNDTDVTDRLAAIGEDVWPIYRMAWRVRGLKKKLRVLGILDRYSYQKSVPVDYLEAPSSVRAEVLRGLLDTDGECNAHGSTVFSSTSRALADDVVWLARSLGGKATIQPTAKRPKFRGPDGALKDGLLCWRATLQMPSGFQSFYVRRKQERVPAQIEARYLSRWIDRIESDGHEACRCITVAASDGLYLTNDFIVTHNSALFAWIVDWLMSTRPNCQGTITANTNEQLEKKTWAAIRTWTERCLTRHWFEVNSQIMFAHGRRSSWFCSPQSCAEENSEAFAGQHAKSSTSFYLFDEASAVPKRIYEVAEGGLTDGEPIIIIAGNPTRNTGSFYECVFGARRERWTTHVIDSRTCKLPNKTLIQEWLEDYGEDSDFFRVRVRGLPPNASELQFIGADLVFAAQRRQVETLADEPLVCGVDVSGGGAAWTVAWWRRGLDARTIPPLRISGEASRDRQHVVSQLAHAIEQHGPTAVFVDAAFGAAVVERLNHLGFGQVYEVNFGGPSVDEHQENQRAYQWALMKEWLKRGTIPTHDERLATDLTGPGFHLNKKNKLVLEAKESMQRRGVASPDNGDALSLTFAQPVRVRRRPTTAVRVPRFGEMGWAG